jgi:flagellar FliL protein
MAKLIPIVFLIAGLVAGLGAGAMLVPPPEPDLELADEKTEAEDHAEDEVEIGIDDSPEFVRLNNQFVVPVVEDDRIVALVVLTLGIEASEDLSERVYEREPRLRDAFLRVLFDHANMGGFRGAFTRPEVLDPLRTALLETAQTELGPEVRSVLITDIARQDS